MRKAMSTFWNRCRRPLDLSKFHEDIISCSCGKQVVHEVRQRHGARFFCGRSIKVVFHAEVRHVRVGVSSCLNIVWIWEFRLLSWIDCLDTRATWNASLDVSTCAFVFLKEPWALLGKVVTNVPKFQADIKVQVKFDWLTSSILCRSMDWCGPERRLALKYLWLQDTSIASRLSSTFSSFQKLSQATFTRKEVPNPEF